MDELSSEKRLLYRLSELDSFEVSGDDPDIRGWDVVDQDHNKLGEIEELIVDPAAMKVRYLDVRIGYDEVIPELKDRHILIPIGKAQLDEKDDHVVLDFITRQNLHQVPLYDGGMVTRIYENRLRNVYDPDIMFTNDDSGDFYTHNDYDADRFFTTRRGTRGRL